MKNNNSDYVCPLEKKPLLMFWLNESKGLGFYLNKEDKICYPIINFIPIFLPYKTNLTKSFYNKNLFR